MDEILLYSLRHVVALWGFRVATEIGWRCKEVAETEGTISCQGYFWTSSLYHARRNLDIEQRY
jgi:hypothetical protein